MRKLFSVFATATIGLIMFGCHQKGASSGDSAAFEKEVQEKLINAKEGEVIELPEGTFTMTRPLILDN